jgi:glycosyltransferase involved in cell wall biosynthesis
MSIALTVLIATRNGEHVLQRTLEGYCRVQAPSHGWKMVIVDNGSEDSTPVILASFKKRLPLETLQQPIAGKNRALNTGLCAVEGSVAIITDDDAIPYSSFLIEWSRYLNRSLDYEMFGGSIDLLFEGRPPKWILKNKAHFDLQFGLRDLPEGPIAAEAIFGPNMALRRSVLENGFRFDEKIGPNGSDPYYPMGAETDFCRRVERSGAKAWFAKEPRVRHIVRSNQLSRSNWAKRFYRHGRFVAQQMWESGQTLPPYMSRPLLIDQVWLLYHRIRMLSPFPLQSINSVHAYHWKRGFCDEWAKRRATTKEVCRPL